MRAATVLLVSFVASTSLACGVLGRGADETDELDGPDETGDDPDDDKYPVPDICEDYVDCIAVTSPGSLGDIADAYAEGGTCWESASLAETCEDACTAAMEDLAEAYPTEPECAGEMAADGCPFVDGDWELTLYVDYDTCGITDGLSGMHELSCVDEGDGLFRLEGELFVSLDCATTSGRSFECGGGSGVEWLGAAGSFSPTGTAGDGDWDYQYDDGDQGCTSYGAFELVYAD